MATSLNFGVQSGSLTARSGRDVQKTARTHKTARTGGMPTTRTGGTFATSKTSKSKRSNMTLSDNDSKDLLRWYYSTKNDDETGEVFYPATDEGRQMLKDEARRQTSLKNYQKALDLYTQAVTKGEETAEVFSERAEVFRTLGEIDSALSDYKTALSKDGWLPQVYHNRGILFKDRKQFDDAIVEFQKALKVQDPRQAATYFAKGECHYEIGQHEVAIDECTRGLKSEEDGHALFVRGICYFITGQTELGQVDLDKVLEADPDVAQAEHDRGKVEEDQGAVERAVVIYSNALKLPIPSVQLQIDLHRRRAVCYTTQKKFESAIADYSQAISLDKRNDPSLILDRARNYFFDLGDFEKALDDLTSYIECVDRSGDAALTDDIVEARIARAKSQLVLKGVDGCKSAVVDYDRILRDGLTNIEPEFVVQVDPEAHYVRATLFLQQLTPDNSFQDVDYAACVDHIVLAQKQGFHMETAAIFFLSLYAKAKDLSKPPPTPTEAEAEGKNATSVGEPMPSLVELTLQSLVAEVEVPNHFTPAMFLHAATTCTALNREAVSNKVLPWFKNAWHGGIDVKPYMGEICYAAVHRSFDIKGDRPDLESERGPVAPLEAYCGIAVAASTEEEIPSEGDPVLHQLKELWAASGKGGGKGGKAAPGKKKK